MTIIDGISPKKIVFYPPTHQIQLIHDGARLIFPLFTPIPTLHILITTTNNKYFIPTKDKKKFSYVGGRGKLLDINNFLPHIYNSHLGDSTIDEDTFLEIFLQNQYPEDAKIEGINDDNIYELYVENDNEL
jgi:hypothetical protein